MTVPNEHDRSRTARRPPDAQEEADVGLGACRPRWPRPKPGPLESRDLYMRALAELENVRKRASRDVEQAHKFALERFANDLIGVKDSLELGLASSARRPTRCATGTEATLKLLTQSLRKGRAERDRAAGRAVQPGAARSDGDAALRRARAELGHAGRPEGLSAQRPAAAPGARDRRQENLNIHSLQDQ